MAKHNAHIIDGVCELLWNNVASFGGDHVVRGSVQLDVETRVVYTSFLVSQAFFPEEIRDHIDAEVERQVRAFYADLGVVCKGANDPKWGRCFEINLPGELAGLSWDQFRNRLPRP